MSPDRAVHAAKGEAGVELGGDLLAKHERETCLTR